MCAKLSCQCEHVSHFVERDEETGEQLEPYTDHEYGETFSELVSVMTDYGKFSVCEHCAKTHF